MTVTKLSDSEKLEIIELYRETEENTVTLAERYGVSSSTIRRILQGGMPADEYKALVQQKQKRSHGNSQKSYSASRDDKDTDAEVSDTSTSQRRRKRSSSALKPSEEGEYEDTLPKKDLENLLKEELLEPALPLDEFDEEEPQDEEDFTEDEEDEEDEELEEELETPYTFSVQPYSKTTVKVLPLSDAIIPKICYLVVDRSTELVTPPLMAFGELGQIPPEESQEKTLPVFDNHRVAKRFSARNQRVVKVPDGRMLKQTSSYLQAKGISRLLIDGQVYRF